MKYYLLSEAADIARTTTSTVRWWIQTGRLKSVKPGRRRLIAESALLDFLAGGAP
jgi:excisionase family DNA binding protein